MRILALRYIVLFFFALFSIHSSGQNNQVLIDSLKKEVRFAEDNEKTSIYNNISRAYWFISLDSSRHYAEKALEIAVDLNDGEGISDAYNRIGNVYYFLNDDEQAVSYYQKSLTIRKKLQLGEKIAGTYNNLALLYYEANNLELSLEFFLKALHISEEYNNTRDIAAYAREVALIYERINNYKKAIEYYQLALETIRKLGDKRLESLLLSGFGNLYNSLSAYDKSLEMHLEALKISQMRNDTSALAHISNSIGIVYQNLKEYDKALDYFQQGLNYYKADGNKGGEAAIINNLGIIYDDRGNKEKALEYYQKSLEMAIQSEDNSGIATGHNNIGLIHYDLGNYDKALKHFNKSLSISMENQNKYSIANTNNNIAKLHIAVEQYGAAIEKLNAAKKIAEAINAKEVLSENYQLSSQLYELQGRYKKALQFYKQYTNVEDSIYSESSAEKIAEMEVKYETEKIEKENEILRKDNQIHVLEINRQKNWNIFLIAFSFLIFLIAILVYSQFRLKQKTNHLLASKNNELKETNAKLKASEQNLKELNATKDRFFSIIAHDLKNPFQALLGYSEILSKKIHTLDKEELANYARTIYESSQNLFNLLANLLQWSRTQLGTINYKEENISIQDAIDEVLPLLQVPAKEKNISLEADIDPTTMVHVDRNVISTVLRNLINNAIKFTQNNGEVKITCTTNTSDAIVSIADSGKGISSENLQKLFRIDQNISTKGTANEEGTGLGLILCKELIENSGGKIWVESKLGYGSIFKFSLPLSK